MSYEQNGRWLLEVDQKEYRFTATPTFMNEFTFYDVARVGDSIIKAAKNDTLYLLREETDFPYLVKDLCNI